MFSYLDYYLLNFYRSEIISMYYTQNEGNVDFMLIETFTFGLSYAFFRP